MAEPRLARIAEHALCAQADPELFFPDKGGRAPEARRICAACPVRQECLDFAIAEGVTGIWGGTGQKERRDLGAPTYIEVAEPVYTCGTEAGARRHGRAGEPVCPACNDAANAAARRRRPSRAVA